MVSGAAHTATWGSSDLQTTTQSNLADYGRLYNWYAVDDARGLCPSGWHVPTDVEYTTLTDGLGGTSVAGGKMKSSPEDSPVMERHEHERFFRFGWWLPDYSGDFYSGGTRLFLVGFGIRYIAWSVYWMVVTLKSSVQHYQRYGFSVRCVRD